MSKAGSSKCVRAVLLSTCVMAGVVLGAENAALAQEGSGKSTVIFGGVEGRKKDISPYAGVIYYLNGDTLGEGFFLRADGYYSSYKYDTPAVAGGKVDADAYAADAMVGYQAHRSSAFFRLLIGAEYADHNLSPSNSFDSNEGSDFGFKVRGEAETDYSTKLFASLLASYGTAKDHYWGRGRLGYDYGGGVVGGEAALEGDTQYDEQRAGAFVSLYRFNPVYLSVSAGYSHTQDPRGGGSVYATLELSHVF